MVYFTVLDILHTKKKHDKILALFIRYLMILNGTLSFCKFLVKNIKQYFFIRENQELIETVEEERKEREWAEKELRAQYEATAHTEKEMHNLQEFIKKMHGLIEDKGKQIETQKVTFCGWRLELINSKK